MRTVFFGAKGDEPAGEPFAIPIPLNAHELRVLGCLIEKQFFTPDVYPMTMNGLVTACNQKTSREPVTNYDDYDVDATLVMLQEKGLASKITGVEYRVPKFREWFCEKSGLRVSEVAILCVMMLRGAQTVNEIKDRTVRIHQFADDRDVMDALDRLMNRPSQPLVVCVGRVAGQREDRYMHLLGGPVDGEQMRTPAPVAASAAAAPREDRVGKLEAEVRELREKVANLEAQFAAFRKQFE
ncbi:MAG: DUF480 domain-containing protein [Acidobacteria bacterium]|nr:DUF480 domain-containing protein [Acidobacteriota bacterium]